LVVPACGIARVADTHQQYRAAVVGPAEASTGTDGVLRIKTGRLLLTTADQAIRVFAGADRLLVRPRSFVEVTVRDYKGVKIAAFSGSVELEDPSSTSFSLSSGKQWNEGVISSTTGEAAASAKTIADDENAAKSLCADPIPATKTPAPEDEAAAPTALPQQPRPVSPHVQSRVESQPLAEPPIENIAPPEPPSAPSPERKGPLEGATLLADAISALRQDHDPRMAIRYLDDLARGGAGSEFAEEAALVRVEALQALGDAHGSLMVLDTLSLPDTPRGFELLLMRADLRAKEHRYRGAVDDYSMLINRGHGAENAFVGRAGCKFQLGDGASARLDLEQYLVRFPNGRFTAEARRALGARP
jgi:hypothetical protein